MTLAIAAHTSRTSTAVAPIRYPQTNEAKFLRGLNVSPEASQERLEYAAGEFNTRFYCQSTWQQMRELLAKAWGEESPHATEGHKGDRTPCRRPNHRQRGRLPIFS